MVVNVPGRDLFWPLALVGGGLVLLLQNLGLIGGKALDRFFSLWPLLVVLLGVGLLVQRVGISSRAAYITGQVLGSAVVVIAVLYAIFGLPAGT